MAATSWPAKLTDDIVRLTDRSGLREYFNPTTGSGHGTDDFSWSAALLIDVIGDRSTRANCTCTIWRPGLTWPRAGGRS